MEKKLKEKSIHETCGTRSEKNRRALVGAIQKFSTEDGPGIRTTVFLKGCPLNCLWCHNPELIAFEREVIRLPNSCIHCGYCMEHCPQQAIYVNEEKQVDIDRERCDKCMQCTHDCTAMALQAVAKEMTVDEILKKVEKDKGFYDNTGGGMTISGGEMLSQPEFVMQLVQGAESLGINVCLDTSGFGDGEWLEQLALQKNVTTILYDMKAINDEIHWKCTGQSNQKILENLIRLAVIPDINAKLQMRMPLVSGLNDDWKLMVQTADFYKKYKIRNVTLLPYHNLGVSKKRNIGGWQETFTQPADAYVQKIKNYFEKEADMTVEIQGIV